MVHYCSLGFFKSTLLFSYTFCLQEEIAHRRVSAEATHDHQPWYRFNQRTIILPSRVEDNYIIIIINRHKYGLCLKLTEHDFVRTVRFTWTPWYINLVYCSNLFISAKISAIRIGHFREDNQLFKIREIKR